MSKIKIKTNKQFHNSVESSLDLIMKEGENIMKRSNFKRAASIAASLLIIGAVAILSADATGVINLDTTFKKLFNIENNSQMQEVAMGLTPNFLPECTSGEVTARVVQSVNDTNTATILLEFSSNSNILHPEMLPYHMKLRIADNPRISFSSGPIYYSNERTIEEAKAESYASRTEMIAETKNAEIVQISPEDNEQNIEDEMEEYNSKYTDKIYTIITLNSPDSILGKNIYISFDSLAGVPKDAIDKNHIEPLIHGEFTLDWTLASSLNSRVIKLDKEIHGIYIDSITITPIGYTMTFSEPVDFDESIDVPLGELDNMGKVYFHGVRFNDGTTKAIRHGGGTYMPNEVTVSFHDIIDIDNVQSIFIGDYVEIPLQ